MTGSKPTDTLTSPPPWADQLLKDLREAAEKGELVPRAPVTDTPQLDVDKIWDAVKDIARGT